MPPAFASTTKESVEMQGQKSIAEKSFWGRQISTSFNEVFSRAPLRRCLQKFLFTLFLAVAFWLGLQGLSLITDSVHGSSLSGNHHDQSHPVNYFADFEGHSECNILATDLYTLPPKDDRGFFEYDAFCQGRKRLLQAMSEGGRIGFDAPYRSKGCNYRWFGVEETCFILERFDALIFVGDDTLHSIYAAINILLRRDLAMGALDISTMDHSLKENCRCTNQFIKQDCRRYFIASSEGASHKSSTDRPYFCDRLKHSFLLVDNAVPRLQTIEHFKQLVPKAPRSRYRPIPIICSFSPHTMASTDAAVALLKFVDLADESERNTPILWIGPTAAGHVEVKGRKGNQEIWDFDRKMANVAIENDVEVLGMWNLTVQATSWDGMNFGEKVAITQAMMVINWLSRLESS